MSRSASRRLMAWMVSAGQLFTVTPLFAPDAMMTVNGKQAVPLPPANAPANPSYVDWTPRPPSASPTPTLVPRDLSHCTQPQGRGRVLGDLGFEPPADWTPGTQVLVFPIEVDVGDWRSAEHFWFRYFFFQGDTKQHVINYLHEWLQGVNAALMAEVNVRLQIEHINFWDTAHDAYPEARADVEAFWAAHPEYVRGPVVMFNNSVA